MKAKRLTSALVAFILHSLLFTLHSQNIISLAGDWQFEIDRNDVGLKSTATTWD